MADEVKLEVVQADHTAAAAFWRQHMEATGGSMSLAQAFAAHRIDAARQSRDDVVEAGARTKALIASIARYGGRCRDCADNDGICEGSGLPCDPRRAARAIEHVLEAADYYRDNPQFLRTPQTDNAAHAVAAAKPDRLRSRLDRRQEPGPKASPNPCRRTPPMSKRDEVLEACPFCGSAPTSFPSGDGTGLMIECLTPGCVNPHVSYYEHGAAIAAWNHRSPTPLAARVEATQIEQMLHDLIETSKDRGGMNLHDWVRARMKDAALRGLFAEAHRASVLREALVKIRDHDGVSYRFGDEVREIARTALATLNPTDEGGK